MAWSDAWNFNEAAMNAYKALVNGFTGGGGAFTVTGLPASIGPQTSAASTSITPATDAVFSTIGAAGTPTTTVQRPNDTTTYAANEAWADTTPTVGGFTLTGAGRISGGSGIITDLVAVSTNDPALLLQGEIWLFDSAVTALADNAAFALSDADAVKLVGIVPFTLASSVAGSGTNSVANVQGLTLGFTCVGSANLRYLIKVKNAYVPAAQEQLTVRAKIVQTN